jgi:peptidoglycan/xylan/chitin deacetylase (PgdA/CDA1 family)
MGILGHVPRPENQVGRRAVIAGVLAVGSGALGACTDAPAGTPSSTALASAPGTASAAPPSATTSTQSPSPPVPGTATTAVTPAVLSTPGPDIVTGPAAYQAVALTFHGAGDLALTAAVLEIARSAGAGLTVFAVGQWLAANPSVGRDIVAAGHDLGNHTWSHLAMTTLDEATARREISRGAGAVASAVGTAGMLFRPSGTPSSTPSIRAAAASSGYARCISYDVDSLDYTDPGASAVLSRTLAEVKAGSIVSLHLGHQGTVDALPGILRGLAAKGLAAVPLTRLLAGAP